MLMGQVCVAASILEVRSGICQDPSPAELTATLVESGASAAVSASGQFALPVADGLEAATVLVSDARAFLFPAVRPVRIGSPATATVIAFRSEYVETLLQSNQIPQSADAGLLFGLASNDASQAVAGARAETTATPVGPYYDNADPVVLSSDTSTGAAGVAAFFDLRPPEASVTVTPQPLSGLRATTFSVPIVASAATVADLILPR
jgi:hypothetical protein